MPFSSQHLFISDLDGTLLQDDASISPQAHRQLSEWLEAGLQFTVATARSLVSVKQILGDLPLRLPVVCANGAYISDFQTGAHRDVQGITKPRDQDILDLVRAQGFQPFISSHYQGKDSVYMSRIDNEAMEWYQDDRQRAGDERLHLVEDLQEVMHEKIICINVLEHIEPLKRLEAALRKRFGELLHIYFYENWYSPEWFWLSIYDESATKGGAIRVLLREMGLTSENLTVFGDNLNDVSMFQLAENAIAMENAKPELKALATEVIGTNQADSVVAYLANQTIEA